MASPALCGIIQAAPVGTGRKEECGMGKMLEELEKLSVAERMQLVEDLWDGIARSNAGTPIPQWQKDALEERRKRHLEHPDSVRTWDSVKQDILRPP